MRNTRECGLLLMSYLEKTSSEQITINTLEAQLGITAAMANAILERATYEYRSKGANHPRTARGTAFYNEIIAAIRETLAPEGYEPKTINNVELAINEEKNVAIWFVRGNQDVGREEGYPESLRKRGQFTRGLFGVHQREDVRTLALFDELEQLRPTPKIEQRIWALLVHIEETEIGLKVQLEFAVPVSSNKSGVLNYFKPRILLSDMEFGQTIIEDKSPEFTNDIDFDVVPSTGN